MFSGLLVGTSMNTTKYEYYQVWYEVWSEIDNQLFFLV